MPLRFRSAFLLTSVACFAAPPAPITAAGVVSHHQGGVYVSNLSEQYSRRPVLKNGGEMGTRADGFAEILLLPGVIAWLGPSSFVRLDSNSPEETVLTLDKGALLVEVFSGAAASNLAIVCQGRRVAFQPSTLARIDAAYQILRVYKGGASIDEKVEVAREMESRLDAAAPPAKSKDRKDPLLGRVKQRLAALEVANQEGARELFATRTVWDAPAWGYVEKSGEFTLIPAVGHAAAALGNRFYSPATVLSSSSPAYEETRARMRESGFSAKGTELPSTGPAAGSMPAPAPAPAAAKK